MGWKVKGGLWLRQGTQKRPLLQRRLHALHSIVCLLFLPSEECEFQEWHIRSVQWKAKRNSSREKEKGSNGGRYCNKHWLYTSCIISVRFSRLANESRFSDVVLAAGGWEVTGGWQPGSSSRRCLHSPGMKAVNHAQRQGKNIPEGEKNRCKGRARRSMNTRKEVDVRGV